MLFLNFLFLLMNSCSDEKKAVQIQFHTDLLSISSVYDVRFGHFVEHVFVKIRNKKISRIHTYLNKAI